MIKTTLAAALLAISTAAPAHPRMIQMFQPTGGILLCPSEWMIAKGPGWGDIYCAIPEGVIKRWTAEDLDGSQGAPIALPAAEDRERMERIDRSACAPGYEQACHARDHGTDGLRRSQPPARQ